MPLKHLGNIHDPKDEKNAKRHLLLSYDERCDPNAEERAWRHHLRYLDGKIIGPPHSWHQDNDEKLLSKASLIPSGILDGEGTLLEQMKRFQATTPTVERLISQGMVGVYIEEEGA